MTDEIFTVVKMVGVGEQLKHAPDPYIDGREHNTARVLAILSRFIIEYYKTIGNTMVAMSISDHEHNGISAPVLSLLPAEEHPNALTLIVTCMDVEDQQGTLEQLMNDMQDYCTVPHDEEAGIHRVH